MRALMIIAAAAVPLIAAVAVSQYPIGFGIDSALATAAGRHQP